MDVIPTSQKRRILIGHETRSRLLALTAVAGGVVSVPLGVLIALLYLPDGAPSVLGVLVLVILSGSATLGLVLATEFRIVETRGLSLPLTEFVSVLLFGLYFVVARLGNPDFFAIGPVLEVSVTARLLVFLVIAPAYGRAYRLLFFSLLERGSSVDYVYFAQRPLLIEEMKPFFESSVRHGDPLSLCFFGIADTKRTDDERSSILIRLTADVQSGIRRLDTADRYSRSLVWFLLPRTTLEHAIVPVQRVLSRIEDDTELGAAVASNGESVHAGIGEYREEMTEPAHLIDAASAAFNSAVASGTTLAVMEKDKKRPAKKREPRKARSTRTGPAARSNSAR